MSGILGLWNLDGRPVSRALLADLSGTLAPDKRAFGRSRSMPKHSGITSDWRSGAVSAAPFRWRSP